MILQRYPSLAWARNFRALALLQLQQNPAAREEYRIILQANPNDGNAHIGLAMTMEKMRDLISAEKELRELVRCQPTFLAGWLELARFLATLNRYEEAFLILNDGLDQNPSANILLEEVGHLETRRDRERAYRGFQRQKTFLEQRLRSLGIEKKTFTLICRLKPRLYEIQLTSGERCMLLAHTPRFDSPGEYSMALLRGEDVPVTLSPRNGGFTQDVKMFLEPKPLEEAEYQQSCLLKKELEGSMEKFEKYGR